MIIYTNRQAMLNCARDKEDYLKGTINASNGTRYPCQEATNENDSTLRSPDQRKKYLLQRVEKRERVLRIMSQVSHLLTFL